MPIPLYFAMNWKESVNSPPSLRAQLGFGFGADGTLLLPERQLDAAPIVLNDATEPAQDIRTETMQALAARARYGCICDFERPCTHAHLALLEALRSALPPGALFVLPERYYARFPHGRALVSPGQLVPNWECFCRQAQKRYADGWFLELEPCDLRFRAPVAQSRQGTLSGCLCAFFQDGTQIRYYDTAETISQKLALAASCGCVAGLALYREWRAQKLPVPSTPADFGK